MGAQTEAERRNLRRLRCHCVEGGVVLKESAMRARCGGKRTDGRENASRS